jgi:hypothetical protein
MGKRNAVLLTKRVVDAARPDHECYHVWDSELSGFALRVGPTGVKTFIIKYRTDGGGRSATQRILTIGRFGPITVEQARKLARAKLVGVAAGEDPAGDLQAKRREMTVGALIDLYEKEGCFIQGGPRPPTCLHRQTQCRFQGRCGEGSCQATPTGEDRPGGQAPARAGERQWQARTMPRGSRDQKRAPSTYCLPCPPLPDVLKWRRPRPSAGWRADRGEQRQDGVERIEFLGTLQHRVGRGGEGFWLRQERLAGRDLPRLYRFCGAKAITIDN